MPRYWPAALILAATIAAYANCFAGPFVLDDQASVVQNPSIRDLARLDRVLRSSPESPVAGRPLVSLSFALNYAVGGLEVSGYHAVNLAWHLACAWLVCAVIRRSLELPAVRARIGASPQGLALAAALVWAVHPLNSEVVNYISQRTESMMAFFLLLTLYAAIRSHASPARAWRALAILACLAGTLCKEPIAVAPLLVALYDRVYLYDSWRDAWRARRRLYLGLAASWLVVGGVVLSGARASVSGSGAGVTVWTYLLNQVTVIVDYLRLSVWPDRLVAFYGWPEPVTIAGVWPQAVVVVALLTVVVVALARVPRIGYLGAWFFVTLAPTSSVVPIATEVAAERRMYLPLAALVLLGVLAVDAITRRVSGPAAKGRGTWSPARMVSAAVLAAVVIALGMATIRRNSEYESAVTLARTVVERRPTAVAHHILGEQLGLARRPAEAEGELRAAATQGDSRALYQLGALLVDGGRMDEAASALESFVATAAVRQPHPWLDPPLREVLSARVTLAQIHVSKSQWADAAAQARQVLAVVPRHPEAQRLLAAALFGTQQWPDAIAVLREYLAARPRDVQARTNLGVALVAIGRLDAAVAEFAQAAQADPSDANARRLLEMALADQRAQQH